MKKIIAAFAALISAFAFASPAQASTPADLGDVRYMVRIMKMTWNELDYGAQRDICGAYYISPRMARDMMADIFHDPYDGAFSDYSYYDVKRASWRLLNWAC